MKPVIVIVDSNALSAMGLKVLLERVIPKVQVETFASVREMRNCLNEEPAHYFISAQSLIEDASYFQERRPRTMVLVCGRGNTPSQCDYRTLDVSRGEELLIRDLLQLMSIAHSHGQHLPPRTQWEEPSGLSPRELEVMKLLARGYINKEIADKLNISITTVITHRKKIMEKLKARSVSDVIIYAVVNGYIDIGNGKD